MKLLSLIVALTLVSPMAMADHHGGDKSKKDKIVKMDTDSDGSVSKAEFLAAQEARFEKMDQNSDGSISTDEYKAAAQEWREKRKAMKENRAEKAEKKAEDTVAAE